MPNRFADFACSALQDIDNACVGLKRCIQELVLVGF